jgi:ribosomal protein S18 acetylase RimI-like enzyme
MPAISLRPATAADSPFLCAVYASTRADELAMTDWDDEQKAQFCEMQFTAQDTHYRQHYLTAELSVILHNGTPAGRLYIDRWSREIRIMDIALLPEHRRHGIGTHLLTDLMAEAAAAEKRLTIHVERMNPALSLYQRLGFTIAEDKGVYLLMEWRTETL